MNLFDVYPVFDIKPVKGKGAIIVDDKGTEYLDFYGGHAVISIGHSHPKFVENISAQLRNLAFYSNSVKIDLQLELAKKLGELSSYEDYNLFLCNSGAEAVENAAKMASFHTGKKEFIAFKKAFHGRTSGSLQLTDNPKIRSPFNESEFVHHVELNDKQAVEELLSKGNIAAVIIEGIQGVAGIVSPDGDFLQFLETACKKHDAALILDEIQSGYGRTGKFFAHQHAGIKADLITTAKGMGNGFPMGGVLISPEFEASYGLLGTTFGGNHLACAAGTTVLDVIVEEDLIDNAATLGEYLKSELSKIEHIAKVTGKGLMLGLVFKENGKEIRSKLLFDHKIFTGGAGNPNIIRLLPPMSINKKDCDTLLDAIKAVLKSF